MLIARPARDGAGRRVYDAGTLSSIGFLDQLNATGMKQADRIRYAALRREGGPRWPRGARCWAHTET